MKRGIILLATMFLLVGCASGAKQEEQPKPIEQTNESKVEKTTIEDTEYYSIIDNGDYTYSYCIKDEEGKVLLQDKNCMKAPQIEQINDIIVGVTIQGGTGQSTNVATFCNVQDGTVSETFPYVLGAKEEYVIYAEADWDKGEYCVTIQNMFDKATYFKQYELEEVSPVATDFITGFEINEEGDIIIVYPSGDDFDEKELILQIQ